MLVTFLLTVGFFVIAMSAMAVGVALTGKKLAGSCGGTAGESCRCSPEKRAQCIQKGAQQADGHVHFDAETLADEDEYALDPLAPPGERRLLQLGLARPERLERH